MRREVDSFPVYNGRDKLKPTRTSKRTAETFGCIPNLTFPPKRNLKVGKPYVAQSNTPVPMLMKLAQTNTFNFPLCWSGPLRQSSHW